ncbi:MAG: ABC transporter ATP-binding protein [Bacteroidales bacterium]|nr:ABC transporter ATP-binding protein [Bacteroidales bacterium]
MKPILRILAYLKHYPWQIAMNILFNVLHILFNLGSYVMIVPFVELLFGTGSAPAAEPALSFSQEGITDWAFWHLYRYRDSVGLWPCLLWISGAYLVLTLVANICRYVALVFLSTLRNGVIEHLRNDLYHKITILPVSYFGRHRRGDIISRMSNDLADIEWSVSTLQSLVKDPINIIVFGATLLFVSWRLFLLFLLVLPLGLWLIVRIGRSLKRNSQVGQNLLGRLFARLEESLAALRAIKANSAEQRREDDFRKANDRYARSMVRVARRRELSSPLSEVLGTLALVIILIVGGSWVVGGHIQPSVFIFFVIIFARIIPPIQSVVKAYNAQLKGSASAARFLEVLDADEVIRERPDAIDLPAFSSGITLSGVGFHYGDGVPILQDIDLSIPRGQTVAIVGPSGAGKSTLVDLLPRFYDATAGTIAIDGHNILDLNINSLRRQFGLVSQNCILFNDTVAANIAFGGNRYSREQIREAARIAGADDFISAMPQGYDTIIGDRGVLLSGGQRQRLSIARAVIADKPILILDEATSALDSESEHAVQQSLDAVMRGRTSIVIAHRLSTIRHADLIVVLDHGRIVQRGTHDQLMADADGLYHKLVSMQSFV